MCIMYPQEQHIEHGPADGERLLGSAERLSIILERQVRSIDCPSRDEEEQDV